MVSLIAAIARNRVIGRDGGLPWHLPADLAHFKRITMGKPVVMGRRTHDEIRRPLRGRENWVVTRQRGFHSPGFHVATSLDEALAACAEAPEVVVIGGAQLYREALPRVERMYLTWIHTDVEGDVRFPEFDPGEWREIESEEHPADERHAHAFRFATLVRVSAPKAATGRP